MQGDFDRAVRRQFHGARISSDPGLFPYRELDKAVAMELFGFRTGSSTQYGMATQRQSVYSFCSEPVKGQVTNRPLGKTGHVGTMRIQSPAA